MNITLTYYICGMRKYILLLILPIICVKNTYSQNNNDAAVWGALIGAATVAAAIEQHKEVLENLAVNYLIANYPEYEEFRLEVIGFGAGGNTTTDNSSVNLVPFGVTKLDNTTETDDRKLLLLFASKGWINQYGLDYSKIKWELWSLEKWNKLLIKYTEISSPIKTPIKDNLLPLYEKTTEKPSEKDLNSTDIYIKSVSSKDKKVTYSIYERKKDDSYENIKDLKLTADGWKRKIRLVYPFYKLKGDDYIVASFNSSMKIFSNENSLGIFLLETKDSMLISRVLLNKINKFMNNK
tara:strand:+ start:527 stop:1411 length:885 start_codon:yes stop_codon:yes gene_type:complete